ncbi:MAG: 3-dehydroquinate synthase [Firmicutes bacterium]|nr:3-dehydroquinate synthase [Bacillota bacterium]
MQNYEILIEEGGLSHFAKHIKEVYEFDELFVVTDQNVFDLYKTKLIEALVGYRLSFVVLPPGEKTKSLEVYQQAIKTLIEKGIKRNHLILAFGGGVIGDLTGFIASTLYRGISYVQIPTTLLAQVDSSIGGKVGIDLKEGKNLIGSFYDPKFVLIDPSFLKTLSKREYANGLAEMIKAGLIGDKKLYTYLLEHDTVTEVEISEAIQVKRNVVLLDPYDKKERMYLNFGHTFGHAIEKKHQYETYLHGEAISYGMLIALQIGIQIGDTKEELYQEVKTLLKSRGLIQEPLLQMDDYRDEIVHDKKNLADGLRFIIVTKPGDVKIVKLKESDIL